MPGVSIVNEMLPVDKAAYHYENAKKLLKVGIRSSIELERIIKELTRAAGFHPKQVKHYLLFGEAFKQALDITSAIYSLRYALKLKPDFVRVKRKLYELLVLSGIEFMTQAQSTVGQHVSPSLFRRANDRFEEAMQLELTLDNPNPDLWVYRAICDLNQGQFDQAFRYIDNAIKIRISTSDFANPSAEMYILKAKILWARGMMDLGNKEMIIAGTISSRHAEVNAFNEKVYSKTERLYNQAVHFFGITEYNEAIKCAQGALLVTKHDTKLYILTSKIYRKMGDLDKAFEQIQLAGRVYRNRGKKTDPRVELPMDITQQTNLIFNDMAIKYAMEGEFSKAIALYNQIIDSEIKLNKGLPDIEYRYYLNRGDCYRGLSQYEEAIVEYLKALDSKPQKQAIWELQTRISLSRYLMSIDCFNNGDFKESDRQLTKCIELNPKVSEYFAARGKTRYYMSHFKEAYDDYKEAHHLNPDDLHVIEKLSQFDKQGAPNVDDDMILMRDVDQRAKNGNKHIYLEDKPIYPENTKPPPEHHLSRPSDEETINALLNYNTARYTGLAPVTKFQVSKILKERAVADAKRRQKTKAKSLRLPSMKKQISALTTSTQNLLLGSYDAIELGKSMREHSERDLKKIFKGKGNQSKSKLFGIIDGAKDIVKLSKVIRAPSAAASGLSAIELKKKQEAEGLTLQNASTARALIEVSKAQTLKVLENPDPRLIKGVKTWHGDPVLLCLEENKKGTDTKGATKRKIKKKSGMKRSQTAPHPLDPVANEGKEGKPVNPKQLYFLPNSFGISTKKVGEIISSGESVSQGEIHPIESSDNHRDVENIDHDLDRDRDNASSSQTSQTDTSSSSSESTSSDSDDDDEDNDYFA